MGYDPARDPQREPLDAAVRAEAAAELVEKLAEAKALVQEVLDIYPSVLPELEDALGHIGRAQLEIEQEEGL